MTDQSTPPVRYYRSLPLETELWLLSGLNNLNSNGTIDALGWPWYNCRDMQNLLNRVYIANLTIWGIDCGIMNGDEWGYYWTLVCDDYAYDSPNRQYSANWFFVPFEERISKLKQDHLLEKAVFSCTIGTL